MCKFHFSLLVCTEIIFTRFEGIPHHTIAIGRPIEWRRRSYSTVSPTILVYNINGFSFVWKTSVLHTATIKIFIGIFFQGYSHFSLIEQYGFYLFKGNSILFQVNHFHQRSILVDFHFDFPRSDRDEIAAIIQVECRNCVSGIVYQNLCFRFCFRITDDSSGIVLKYSEDVFPVEIECHSLIIRE